MLSKAPLIRLLLPLIFGIIISEISGISCAAAVIVFITIFASYVVSEALTHRKPILALRFALLPTALLMLLCTCLGMAVECFDRAHDFDTRSVNGKIVCGKITQIRDKENSTELRMTLVNEPLRNSVNISGAKIQARLNHKDFSITEGDIIAFLADFTPIRNLGNPEEFDYKQYMFRHGYIYTASLPQDSYKVVGHCEDLASSSAHAQRFLSNVILSSRLEPSTKRLICTAVLGDASFVDSETRQVFSEAGIAHILAISGLHIGIILTIITLLLRPLDYLRVRHLRIIFSILAIIGVLYITGSSPSAVRSAIMSIFVMVALMAHRESDSLNSLCAAAIIILLISPNSIHDVGFQLSFTAVFMIVVFMTKLNRISPRQRVAFAIASSLLTIALANIGCSIISAYYFHTLPVLSLLSNLIIIPLLPFFIGLSIFFLVFSAMGIDVSEVGQLLDSLSAFIHRTAEIASQMPLSHIGNVSVATTTIAFYFLAVGLLIAFVYNHKLSTLICSIICVVASIISSTCDIATQPRRGVIILNDYRSTPILYFEYGNGYVWCEDEFIDRADFSRKHINLLSKYHIDSLYSIPEHSIANINAPFAMICGKRIAVIASTKWKHSSATKPLSIDYLVITKRYYGDITSLLHTFAPKAVVLSGDIFPKRSDIYVSECKRLGISCHNISTDGAIFISPCRTL